jgi:hypothetical protein
MLRFLPCQAKSNGIGRTVFFCLPFYSTAMHTPENHPAPIALLALLNPQQRCTLEELIATGEAVFCLIRFSELDTSIKNAFYQLEKQFDLYASQVMGE